MTLTHTTPCDDLRAGSEDIWQQIFGHPFLRELEEGTLPDDKLLFYFVQNVHYIRAALKFSAMTAAKATDDDMRAQALLLLDFGRSEVARQSEYVQDLAHEVEVNREIAPTAFAYTRHLLTLAAYGDAVDLLIGLLPCEWTYHEFSQRLAPVVTHPVQARWLNSFAGEEHNEVNRHYHEVLNLTLPRLPQERLADLRETFRTSSRYEWMFWEMAYRKERWPV
jgi:thiaminase (transcriptional activator TenA)